MKVSEEENIRVIYNTWQDPTVNRVEGNDTKKIAKCRYN